MSHGSQFHQSADTFPPVCKLRPESPAWWLGTYTGHITVTGAGGASSPAIITVILTVAAPPVQHTGSLSWNASTSPGVVSYNAYRSTTPGGPYMLLANAITGLSLSDATVQSGVTYYYVVTAIDSAGEESPNSNEAKAVIP